MPIIISLFYYNKEQNWKLLHTTSLPLYKYSLWLIASAEGSVMTAACQGLKAVTGSHAHTVVWECCKDDQQSQWEMLKFDPQLPLNPLSDRHQIWHAWLRHGYLSPRKNWAQSVKGFLLPIYAKYTPPCSLRYATLRYATLYACLLLFFGSSNRLQPRPLHGF